MPRKYQHTMELLPEIKEMLANGMTQREVKEKLGLTGEMIEASGIFGKSKKYKCKCGETNSEGTEYCKTCGKNIMGMIVDEMIIYKEFKKKVEILEGM